MKLRTQLVDLLADLLVDTAFPLYSWPDIRHIVRNRFSRHMRYLNVTSGVCVSELAKLADVTPQAIRLMRRDERALPKLDDGDAFRHILSLAHKKGDEGLSRRDVAERLMNLASESEARGCTTNAKGILKGLCELGELRKEGERYYATATDSPADLRLYDRTFNRQRHHSKMRDALQCFADVEEDKGEGASRTIRYSFALPADVDERTAALARIEKAIDNATVVEEGLARDGDTVNVVLLLLSTDI